MSEAESPKVSSFTGRPSHKMVPVETPSAEIAAAQRRMAAEFAAWKQGVIGAVQGALLVASSRILLLLSGAGAFYLSLQAVAQPEPLRIVAALTFDVGVFLPCAWIAIRQR